MDPLVVDSPPHFCGREGELKEAIQKREPICWETAGIDFERIKAGASIALHMHQPLIPAGGTELRTARIISNLQYMLEHLGEGDNHNAPVFQWCYRRMGQFIPELLSEGKKPRVMLDYSGCLLYGFEQMGSRDILDSLNRLVNDPWCRQSVEFLGTAWGHPVAPSTPIQDFRLHVQAWQEHFASLFGFEALSRIRGFSPPEMALPNHLDVAYHFVQTLRDCGYEWVLVQEHTVEQPDGKPLAYKHIPHRLVCINSQGQKAEIIAIIKTQGSDSKLVGQMQPWYEAKGLNRLELGGRSIPPLVTQIADGENGGVMMNEFPPKYFEVVREASGSLTPLLNVSEYLAYLRSVGIKEADLPPIQPIHQHLLFRIFEPASGPQRLKEAIDKVRKENPRFFMEGGSWTNNISWVRGYDDLLGPLAHLSHLFYEKILQKGVSPLDSNYRQALFYLLSSQTSCFRYWGSGIWTEFGKEICRRGIEFIKKNF
ncbi:glycosyl hydrolase family 57 [Candidatus Methylacidiphilum infernorum]|uniref:Glycosyl hydrolase family 57 n=1 Tax=Candidatus Methylacidiphilum infernorum TaxID=511746 RepID=A0ABX7PVN4_9BACT|nr:glycosyl hydrolase family 57 [Candidatus Methylacidiphilum infernorum]QSR86804.1 glycosyl hydrolase family 57 [Candidatus Methylacidiphilum infernorum]